MFGIIQPCRHTLTPALREQWWSHLCGLCLGLRDGYGQTARAATNVDAVALSVLVEAQREAPAATRRAGPCPGRGFRTADVVRADDPGVSHAVAVSLTMGATKLADHVADGDGWVGRIPVVPAVVARRWSRAGDRAAGGVGLDAAALREAAATATRQEATAGLTLDDHCRPTEDAAARACRHTAVLGGRPANADALDAVGRAFGRIVYLLDATRDRDEDERRGRFNPLTVTVAEPARRDEVAAGVLAEAHRHLSTAFARLALPRPDLARALFVDQVGRAVHAATRTAEGHTCGSACARPAAAVAVGGVTAAAGLSLGLGTASGSSDSRSFFERWNDRCCGWTDCCECCCCGEGDGCCGCDCCGCDCCDCGC